MTATTDETQRDHKLFERSDDFGPYISTTDLSAFEPKLDELPKSWPQEVREAALEAAVKNAPEPESPVGMTYELVDRAQAMYSSFDSKFKDAQEARKVAARWMLCQEPQGEVTDQEREKFKTSDPLLVHAHRTRMRFGVSLSVLAGWAYDEEENGDIKELYVGKDIALAMKKAEDKRRADLAEREAAKAANKKS